MGNYVIGFDGESLIGSILKADLDKEDNIGKHLMLTCDIDKALRFTSYEEAEKAINYIKENRDKIKIFIYDGMYILGDFTVGYKPEYLKIFELRLTPIEIEKQKEDLA